VHVRETLPSESFEQLAMPHFERLYNFACWLCSKAKLPVILCLREMRDLKNYLSHVHDLRDQVALILIPHELGAFELPEAIRMKSCFVGHDNGKWA
jgi:hypothetical protein